MTITDCSVYKNKNVGLETTSNACDVTLRRYRFYNGKYDDMKLAKCKAKIINFLIYNNDDHGILAGDSSDVTIKVCHSLINDNGDDGFILFDGTVKLTNCIITSNDDDGIQQQDGKLTHSYNLISRNGDGNLGSGTKASTAEICFDPKFVSSSDYHMQSS